MTGLAVVLFAAFLALVSAHHSSSQQNPEAAPDQATRVVFRVQGPGSLPTVEGWRVQEIVGSGLYIEVPAAERGEAMERLREAGFRIVSEWGEQ